MNSKQAAVNENPEGTSVARKRQRFKSSGSKPVSLRFEDSDPLPYTDPAAHYHMSLSTRYFENITTWLGDNAGDPAFHVCHL
jgi:hypothetical protein